MYEKIYADVNAQKFHTFYNFSVFKNKSDGEFK